MFQLCACHSDIPQYNSSETFRNVPLLLSHVCLCAVRLTVTNKLLKDLYDCFYTPPELAATKREIEECHRALIEALGKPERRLVLKIIDAKDHISEDTSLDSFISGFRLAWRLSAELNHYNDERPARCQAAEKPGARFTLKKEDDEQ